MTRHEEAPEEPGAFEGAARWFYDEATGVEWTAPEEPIEEEIDEGPRWDEVGP